MRPRGWAGLALVVLGGVVVLVVPGVDLPVLRNVTIVVVTLAALLVAARYGVDGATESDHWEPVDTEPGHRVPVPRVGRSDDAADGSRLLAFVRGDLTTDANASESPQSSSDDERVATDPAVRTHDTGRWRGLGAVAVAFLTLGVLGDAPGLILSGAVAVAFVGVAGSVGPPPATAGDGTPAVRVARRFDPESPDPGDDVTVTVTVRNDSRQPLTDVRVVDGVPPALAVTDGTPRHGVALGPDGTATFSYTVTAVRGEHEWQPTQVTLADAGGVHERTLRVPSGTTLACRAPVLDTDRLPLRSAGTQYAGQVQTDEGGPGIEFHSVREYRPGDPLSRIDWYRRAETGEFATLAFREERAAKVLLLVDGRRAAYRAPTPDGYHAVQRGVDATGRVFTGLLDTGDRVGVAALGRRLDDCWLDPRAGDDHRAAGLDLLTTHPALSPVPPERALYQDYRRDRRTTLQRRLIERVHQRLSPTTQVLFVSPCCDDFPVTVARRLDAYGHAVTVVSPDPTAADTPAHRRAREHRDDRLGELRRAGVRVLDWGADESFDDALARAQGRWSG